MYRYMYISRSTAEGVQQGKGEGERETATQQEGGHVRRKYTRGVCEGPVGGPSHTTHTTHTNTAGVSKKWIVFAGGRVRNRWGCVAEGSKCLNQYSSGGDEREGDVGGGE